MKYMLLIYQGTTPTPPSPEWDGLSDEEKGAVYTGYKALNETPGVTSGMQMEPPEMAATVRVQDGRTLTADGPFVELKEAIGGYLFFDANDLDAAIELAARIPTRSTSLGTVDVVADGTGLSSRAGTVLLALTAQRLALTDGPALARPSPRIRAPGVRLRRESFAA